MQLRTLLIASAVTTGLSVLVVGMAVDTRVPGDHSGYQPAQPIAYSHRVHAGENHMDCQFCHFGAEKGRHAGIPPLSVCMKCHEKVKKDAPEVVKIRTALETGTPVAWNRVHRLPAFVYFDHSRHVNGGVACQDCHGEIQTMDTVAQAHSLLMGECLACHRDKNRQAQAAGKVPPAPTDCNACHH